MTRHVGTEDVINVRRLGRSSSAALNVMLAAAVALAVLAAIKFLNLLVEADFDIAQAPVAFLLPIALLVAGVVLAAQRRGIGVWTIAVVSLVLLVVFVVAIVNRGLTQQNWADALLVFAGTPLAIAALAATPGARKATSRHADSAPDTSN